MATELKMKFSARLYWSVVIFIPLLPLSANWDLLLFGETAKGLVTKIEVVEQESINDIGFFSGKSISVFSIIEFETKNATYLTREIENVEYPIGKEIWVQYEEDHPETCLLLTGWTLYFGNHAIIPAFFFMMWSALYLTFRSR